MKQGVLRITHRMNKAWLNQKLFSEYLAEKIPSYTLLLGFVNQPFCDTSWTLLGVVFE